MKNVFAILVVAAALMAVSCGGNANKANDVVEEVEVVAVVDSTANEACCADTTCCAEGAECKGTAESCAK